MTATSLSRTINVSQPLNSLTISGDPNPANIASEAVITVDDAGALTQSHQITLTDGYGVSHAHTFITANDSTAGNAIGVQTAQGSSDEAAAATQITAAINAGSGSFTATAVGATVKVVQDITWGAENGNEAITSTNGSGGAAAGVTVPSAFTGGREAITSLKVNHTELVAVGEFSYIESVREGILKARTGMSSSTTPLDFRIPDDWDLEWNHKLGPIWTPDSTTGTDDIIKCWLKSDKFSFSTASDQQVSQLNDQSTEGNDFGQATASALPLQTVPVTTRNRFQGITFDGTDDVLFCMDATYGSDFDVGASDDFGIFFVITTSLDQNNQQTLIQIDNDNTDGAFNITLDTSSALTTLKIHTRASSTDYNRTYTTAFSHTTTHIIFVGRIGGTDTVRVDGTTLSAAVSDDIKAISGGTHDCTLGCAFGVGGGTSESQFFQGTFYEFIFIKEGSGDISNIHEKYEGYLAWKYDTVATLAGGHPYKSEPPRATICL
jgi:hypothetical protein